MNSECISYYPNFELALRSIVNQCCIYGYDHFIVPQVLSAFRSDLKHLFEENFNPRTSRCYVSCDHHSLVVVVRDLISRRELCYFCYKFP